MIEHIVVAEENGLRADKIVANVFGEVSYTFLQKIFRMKRVKVNGKHAKASDHLNKDDVIKIFASKDSPTDLKKTNNAEFKNQKLAKEFKQLIIFENEDLIAINKPTNLAVQMGSKVKISVETMMKSYRNDLKLVHRIDKDTSGILLIAKGRLAAQKLTRLFRENKIYKTYLAIVDGKIKTAGTIDNFLEKSIISGEEKIRIAINEDGLHAITKYFPKKISDPRFKYYTLLELHPQTGRKHQLRVHCAEALHAPILGDKKYNKNLMHRELFLHAYKVDIEEIGVKITAPLPEYFPKA